MFCGVFCVHLLPRLIFRVPYDLGETRQTLRFSIFREFGRRKDPNREVSVLFIGSHRAQKLLILAGPYSKCHRLSIHEQISLLSLASKRDEHQKLSKAIKIDNLASLVPPDRLGCENVKKT